MERTFILLLMVFLLVDTWIKWTAAENETILKEPHQVKSTWTWVWRGQWRKQDDNAPGKAPYYTACDTSSQQDRWIRSNVFLVGNAIRIDVTVQYAVLECSSISLPNCKQNMKLFIYKTNTKHEVTTDRIPEPSVKPEVYQLFGITSPINLTSSGFLSRDKSNTETYSFITNSSTPYHYLAINYEGGCFALYSVTISYLVCPSLALPSGLIQLPRTIPPIQGSIQVSGSCAANAQPLVNNAPLYGHCNANGEWSSNVTSGKCLCKAGFGKYLIGSGAECKGCPNGTYQEKASNNECKPCPLNSVQDVKRTKCNCAPNFYRTKDESMYDNCTGQPAASRDVKSIFKNSSYVTIEWATPLDLGGRSDVYYQVECNKCNNEGRDCNMDCTGAVITHTPRTSRKATVQHLSAYTYYQFKVFSKNGVSHLAEINGEKSKYAVILVRTSESGTSDRTGGTSTDDKKPDVIVPVLASLVALLLLVVIVGVIYFVQRKRILHREKASTKKETDIVPNNIHHRAIILDDIPGETNDNYAYVLEDTLWEVPRENVSVIKRLGSGNFGYVDKAVAIGLYGHLGQVTVAVKTLKENASAKDKEDFLTELQLMMKLERHPRVVELLGCCTKSEGPMSIILEYLPYGDLLGYLRRSRGHEDTYSSGDLRPEGKLTSRDLLQFAWMIADGMSFLAQNKCVHRDLAARNVLVGENKICKISDLGLARTIGEDVYTRSKAARLPIKWMPPESLFRGQSSIASDVWSYGIVLWEIFTLGDSPYPKYKGKDIPRLLQQGYRMPKPLHLSDTLYSLMLRCWQDKPEDRPSFSLICDEINTYYNSTQDYINLDVFEDSLYINFDLL